MALFGWGVQPGDNRGLGDIIYDRLAGHRRQEFYVVSPTEPKAKKARRGFFIFQGGRKINQVAKDPTMRQVLGDVNARIIRDDEWRRDQGGASIGRGGYGISMPEVDPGPPAGFIDSPQIIYGPPGGYYDGNGMWHDEGR